MRALNRTARIAESSTSTGAGDITVAGALTGCKTFAAACALYDWFEYLIEAVDAAGMPSGEWEAGIGMYSAANTLTRVLVQGSSLPAGGRISFAAGSKAVTLTRLGNNIDPVMRHLAHGGDTTAVTAATLITWRPRRNLTILEFHASLATASSSGDVTLDIRVAGVSLLSTLLTIPSGSKTSASGTQAVFSDPDLVTEDEVTIVATTAGTGAAGLRVTLVERESPIAHMDGLSLRLSAEDLRPFHTRASAAWAVVPNYAHNLFSQSVDMGAPFSLAATTLGASMPGHRGTLRKLQANASTAVHGVEQASVVLPSRIYEFSIEAMAAEETVLVAANDSSGSCTFNLATGVATNAGLPSATLSMELTPAGTYICRVRYTSGAGASSTMRWCIRLNSTYLGTGTDGLWCGQPQLQDVTSGYFGGGYTATTAAQAPQTLTAYATNVLRVLPSPVGVSSALREPQSTNKATNYNANPTDLTGVSKIGDAAATLTVVNDAAALAYAGLSGVCSTGNVYKLDNSLGATAAYALASQAVGNTNPHSLSVFSRGDAGTLDVHVGTGPSAALPAAGSYVRSTATGACSNTTAVLRVGAAAGKVVYFILNQLEEQPFVTSPIVVAGSAVTRARDEISIPVAISAGQPFGLEVDFVKMGEAASTTRVTGGSAFGIECNTAQSVRVWNGATNLIAGTNGAVGTRGKVAYAGDGSGRAVSLNGAAAATAANTHDAATGVVLGALSAGADSNAAPMYFHEVRTRRTRCANNKLRRMTA